MFTTPLSRRGLTAATVALATLPLAACSLSVPTGPSPQPPPKVASLAASYSFSAQGAPTCTGSYTWTYTLVTASAGDGPTATVKHDIDSNFPSTSNTCTLRDNAGSLHPGTWRVTLTGSAGAPLANCTLALAGARSLNANTCAVS